MEREEYGPSLLEAFLTVPDPRKRRGQRHPLPAILTLATAAMLSGARSIYAIWQWGRLQDAATIRALGFTRATTPAVSTLHLVFSRLDAKAFEAALQAWAQRTLGDRAEAIAIDGKGLRGIHGEELPGVRLVAGYADGAGLVLAQAGGKHQGAGGRADGSTGGLGRAAGGGPGGHR
jgi:hypothetical protein